MPNNSGDRNAWNLVKELVWGRLFTGLPPEMTSEMPSHVAS